jgi:GT2 family glycosyltransferase
MNPSPLLSIIIPTHNRSAMLIKSLEALSHQSWPAHEVEVLVVADSCRDDTIEKATDYSKQVPYRLHLLSHNARSASATRNLGAANAQGSVLLFLDDDVIAKPKLVEAHMQAQNRDVVVLGYSEPILPEKPSWWQYNARRWWEDHYRIIRQPGYRFSYRDFFSGNVSMPAVLFQKVGCFDTSITGRLEDYELGIRLLKAGARFRYVPEAIGYHYDTTDLRLWICRLRMEGIANIHMGQRHPEFRTSLFGFTEPRYRWIRILRTLAFSYPRLGDRLEWLFLRLAVLYERLRLRGYWQKVVRSLREYNYWRGVATTIGGRQALASWLQEARMPPALAPNSPVIDMAELPPSDVLQEMLKQANNMGLRLAFGGVEILAIPPQLGMEPLREEHLHSAFRELTQRQFIPSLALHLIRSTPEGGLLCLSNLQK